MRARVALVDGRVVDGVRQRVGARRGARVHAQRDIHLKLLAQRLLRRKHAMVRVEQQAAQQHAVGGAARPRAEGARPEREKRAAAQHPSEGPACVIAVRLRLACVRACVWRGETQE